MKYLAKITLLSLVVLMSAIIGITACGGHSAPGGSGGVGATLQSLIFNANPAGLHFTHGFGAGRASISSPFAVNAQSPAPGGGNFAGFCEGVPLAGARGATVIYGIGRWSTGSCDDAATPDSDVGVSIPANGQIGNLTVDAIAVSGGTGSDSGSMEVKIIHADGTQTITPITCALGPSTPGQKLHCQDKNATDDAAVVAGDQVSARFFFNSGEQYRAIRVNIEYATPTF
jgi:hypothetical protein